VIPTVDFFTKYYSDLFSTANRSSSIHAVLETPYVTACVTSGCVPIRTHSWPQITNWPAASAGKVHECNRPRNHFSGREKISPRCFSRLRSWGIRYRVYW